jgi:hypothetical protein
MKPKIAYLIDEGSHWGEPPDWKFYTEDDVPSHKIEHASKSSYKRIVYWEIEEEND